MGLDIVNLMMGIEEEFEIEIPDAVAEKIVTVGDVVDIVVAELTRTGRPADPIDVFERIRKQTHEAAEVDLDLITRESRFVQDLGMD
jgi:acyl carrier protein